MQLDPVFRPTVVLDAYLQLRIRPTAHLRVGSFKVPFGGESLTADEKTIPIERSVVSSFSPDRDNGNQARDVGVELLGHAGGRSANLFEYSVAAMNGSGLNNVAGDHAVAAATRLIVHPIQGLSVGADYFQGKTTTASPAGKRREEFEARPTRRDISPAGASTCGATTGRFSEAADMHCWLTGWIVIGRRLCDWKSTTRTTRPHKRPASMRPEQITDLTDKIRVQANGGARKDPIQGDITPVFLVQLQIGL